MVKWLNLQSNFSFNYPNISFTSLKGRRKSKVIGAYSNLLNQLFRGEWQITESRLCYDRVKELKLEKDALKERISLLETKLK